MGSYMTEKLEWWEKYVYGWVPQRYVRERDIPKLIAEAERRKTEEFRQIVKVRSVNESNGRYNCCNEIMSKLS